MFLTPLILRADSRPDFWTVYLPLVWADPQFGNLVCPEGFRTDLASIPRALQGVPTLNVNGVSRRPAAMHDWLYGGDRSRGKDFADEFLRAALLAEGADEFVANEFYEAVHLFGDASWDGDAAKSAAWAKAHPIVAGK